MEYTLDGHSVIQKFTVENLEEEETMPFFVGGHPAFNCPIVAGDDYNNSVRKNRRCISCLFLRYKYYLPLPQWMSANISGPVWAPMMGLSIVMRTVSSGCFSNSISRSFSASGIQSEQQI